MVLLATTPPQVPNLCKTVIGRNPGAASGQARYDLAVTLGVDIEDPCIIAAALGGSFYVKDIARTLTELEVLDPEQLGAVELAVDMAMLHWKAALVDMGAVPIPEGWND